jgi:hypothetical protein
VHYDAVNEAAPHERKSAMKIVPTSIEEQINRVDRQRSLYIGISAAVLAVWSVYRLIWALYIGMTFGWFFGSMVFQLVLWGVIGAVAAVAATGFLTRYSRGS